MESVLNPQSLGHLGIHQLGLRIVPLGPLLAPQRTPLLFLHGQHLVYEEVLDLDLENTTEKNHDGNKGQFVNFVLA